MPVDYDWWYAEDGLHVVSNKIETITSIIEEEKKEDVS